MEDCDFCKIVAKKTPAEVIYETATALAFFPLEPATRGHTMVIPKAHVENFLEATPKQAAELAVVCLHIGRAIREVLKPDGMNLITSAGEAASQSVMHLHYHLLPRYWGDAVGEIWPSKVETPEPILEGIADALRQALGSVILDEGNPEQDNTDQNDSAV